MLFRHAQPLFPLQNPGMTHSQLFGDFVCIDVLASFADVNLKGYEKVSTHPSTPAYLGGHFKAWILAHFFVCFIALHAHVKYRQSYEPKSALNGLILFHRKYLCAEIPFSMAKCFSRL